MRSYGRTEPVREDYDAYKRTWKYDQTFIGKRDFLIHSDVYGWKRFVLCGPINWKLNLAKALNLNEASR